MVNMVDRLGGASASLSFKAPIVAASTGPLTLSGFQTIDGLTFSSTQHPDLRRVLVKDQVDGAQNGVYEVGLTTWQRVKDFNSVTDFRKGTRLYVSDGNSQSGGYIVNSTMDPESFSLGDDDIDFTIQTDPITLTEDLEALVAAAEAAGGLNTALTQALMATSTIDAGIKALRTFGFATVTDGGAAQYVRVASEPAHDGKVRSVDRFLPNGTTSAGNGGWWEIDEPVIRAAMLYDLTAADAMDWLEPLLEQGFARVFIDAGDYDLDGESPIISLSANLHLTFGNGTKFSATLATGTAERVIHIDTNGFDLLIDGGWTIDGEELAPVGLRIFNGTTTYTKLCIEEGLRVVNCKRTVANGAGCMGVYIGGAYDNPKLIRPYVYNCNRVVGGGTTGSIGTHGVSVAYSDIGGTLYWTKNPYVEEPYIERILSEEAFASADNQDCDCLRVFTFFGPDTGEQPIYSGNACKIVGGTYRDFRGRAIKTQSGFVDITGNVRVTVFGGIATGLLNANFDIISIQYGAAFNIDGVTVEMRGSGAQDPFQGTLGGCVISCYVPASLSRSIYRGNINNIVVLSAGDVGTGASGFHTIIQASSFDGTVTIPFMLNVNNVASHGQTEYFMAIPPEVSTDYHSINVGNVVCNLITSAFVAESTDIDHVLLNLNVSNFINTNPTKPMTLIRGTTDPLDVTVLRNDTVFGIAAST